MDNIPSRPDEAYTCAGVVDELPWSLGNGAITQMGVWFARTYFAAPSSGSGLKFRAA